MQRLGSWVLSVLRGAVVGWLCVAMVDMPVLAQASASVQAPAPIERRNPASNTKGAANGTAASGKTAAGQIRGQERVLHALNRLTFGPRPGEVEQVEKMGLQQWIVQQLNPSMIDDSAFEARMEMFPAMKLPQQELMEQFPSPQMIRQIAIGKASLPGDPTEHALYADRVAFFKMAQAKREAAQAANGAGADGQPAMQGQANVTVAGDDAMGMSGKSKAALPGDGVDPATPSMEAHEEQLYSGLDAVKVINLPPEERMQRILAMRPEELLRFRQSLSRGELAALVDGLRPQQKEMLISLQGAERVVAGEALQTRLLRDIYSERQLEAVMTDFWLNHFNVYLRKNQNEPFLLPAYERDVIRPRALGRFEDLLVATAESPAMMVYLDNWQSIGPDSMAARNGARFAARAQNPQVKQALQDRGLNENYARELMELHTLGVGCEVSEDHPVSALDKACGRGYTQKDVTEVAKVLTGWTVSPPKDGLEFQFEERRHGPGSKSVLGTTIHENGQLEGLEVLHMLATSPATAKFVSTQLAVRFVSDAPPPALIDRMTKAWMSSGGDMKVVLRAMVSAPEFWSPNVYRAKVKTPLEFVVSAVRASGAEVTNAQPLVQALDRLGMPLYGMQTPNGYNWTAEPWVSTGALVSRMNFALVLTGDRIPGTRTDWRGLLGETGAGGVLNASMTTAGTDESVAVKEMKLETILLGQPTNGKTRATVLEQFGDAAAQDQAERDFPVKVSDPEMMAGALSGGNMAVRQDQRRVQAAPMDKQAAVMAGLLIGSPEFQRR